MEAIVAAAVASLRVHISELRVFGVNYQEKF